MTLLIAHRGLVDGPDKDKENTLAAIISARTQGYDVEIDVWFADGSWWLGHDAPQTKIEYDWLRVIDRHDYLDRHHAWVHAKSIETLFQLRKYMFAGHVFYHEEDPCVLTSSGYIWTYPGQSLTPHSICVMPEYTDAILKIKELQVFGYCSDWVNKIRDTLQG
jgi:hypothetical protein